VKPLDSSVSAATRSAGQPEVVSADGVG